MTQTNAPSFGGRKEITMNKYKLIAAFIIALTLMVVFLLGKVISDILFLITPPWGLIANGLLVLAVLTLIVYWWIGKLEKKDKR